MLFGSHVVLVFKLQNDKAENIAVSIDYILSKKGTIMQLSMIMEIDYSAFEVSL